MLNVAFIIYMLMTIAASIHIISLIDHEIISRSLGCTDNRPIIGIGRLSAVLPIIGIDRLLRRYRPIIVYTLGKYKKRYEGSRLRRVESGLWMQFHGASSSTAAESRRCTC